VPDAKLAVAHVGRRSSRSAKRQRWHGRASDGASRVREEKRRSSVGMGVSCLVYELFWRFGSGIGVTVLRNGDRWPPWCGRAGGERQADRVR